MTEQQVDEPEVGVHVEPQAVRVREGECLLEELPRLDEPAFATATYPTLISTVRASVHSSSRSKGPTA